MTNKQINIAIAEACGIDLEKYRTYASGRIPEINEETNREEAK